ncbi:MAG: DUF3568 family protein [Opitutaceae bacterium]|nr:DUF3568 family protein [Opitutaceae bacterium]
MNHRFRFLSSAAAVCAAGAALFTSGCSSVELNPEGSMVAVYRFGEFRMLLNTTAPVASQAAQRALAQFDLYQTGATTNTYDAKIVARTRSDQQVVIEINEINSRQCMLRIRWGAGGDVVRSRRLYEAIEAGIPSA